MHAVHPDPLTLAPDAGRTSGNFTVALPPSDQLCAPQHVECTDMTVTNVTTGMSIASIRSAATIRNQLEKRLLTGRSAEGSGEARS